jgi:hypothetical protein
MTQITVNAVLLELGAGSTLRELLDGTLPQLTEHPHCHTARHMQTHATCGRRAEHKFKPFGSVCCLEGHSVRRQRAHLVARAIATSAYFGVNGRLHGCEVALEQIEFEARRTALYVAVWLAWVHSNKIDWQRGCDHTGRSKCVATYGACVIRAGGLRAALVEHGTCETSTTKRSVLPRRSTS